MVTDLVIVGAGPCGLVSALLAKQAGLSCVVLERKTEEGLLAMPIISINIACEFLLWLVWM